MRLLIRLVRIAYDAFIRFNADDGWAVASHIALSTLLAMFPFLIVVTALAGFAGSKDLADQAAGLLMQAWPPEVAGPISGEIHRVLTTTRTDVLTMGLVVAVYFASSGIESLRIGLNRAYDQKETRPWWLLRLESIGYVLLSAVALLIFTLLVVLAPSLILIGVFSSLKYLDPTSLPMTLTRYGLASTILVVALYAVHVRLPAGHRSLGEMTPGIVATLGLWLVSGAVFGRYLAHFTSTYVSTYAGLASVVAALIYLYLNASIFIYGGELNTAICAERKIRKAIAQSDDP